MVQLWQLFRKWLTVGLGVKRWLVLLLVGITIISLSVAYAIAETYRTQPLPGFVHLLALQFLPAPLRVAVGLSAGLVAISAAVLGLNRSILAPYMGRGRLIDTLVSHSRRQKGIKLVAIGGGTGLPSVLRGFKALSTNITAIVTMADDGGSSGKLRREMGVQPPGDLRNNLAALADDEDLMTQLFQYRFAGGGLEGHSFGNLFLTALAGITGGMDAAAVEAGRVLAIQGQVLPSTMQDVTLMAEVRLPDGVGLRRVVGESKITEAGGIIERVFISPENARAYPEAIRAILSAELIVIGPGSLYTSIIPNLLVGGIVEALRASSALRIYVCNVATQKGETDGFTVADHVLAVERNVGRGIFQVVLANNCYPMENAGPNTHFVLPAPADHEIRERYEIFEADLADPNFPWRHSPQKLRRAILDLAGQRINRAETVAVT
jgi:uncharacterized cofD-like protein